MSELAPNAERAKEERELADLEAKAARKRTQLEGNTAFGKYDQIEGPLNQDGRPIAGSHADYHSQRPSDGIVRDNLMSTGYRQAEGGYSASAAKYEDQVGDTQAYYDKLMNAENQEVIDPAEYDNMGVMQLAKEQAKAEILGDIAGAKEMRGVFDVHILQQAAAEGSGITDADLDKETARYAGLVEKFKASMESGTTEAAETTVVEAVNPAVLGGEATTEVVSETTTELPTVEAQESTTAQPDGPKFPGQEVEAYIATDGFEKGAEVIFNDEVMTVEEVLSGEKVNAYVLIDAEGNKTLAFAEQLSTPEDRVSAGEKLKAWWGNNKESVKNVFRPAYWGERWTNAISPKIGEVAHNALNVGIKEEDSPEEAEKKRKRNRILLIAGGLGLAAATIAGAAYGVGFSSGHHGVTEALGNGAGGGGHGDTLSAQDQAIADSLTPKRSVENHAADFLTPQDTTTHPPELNPSDSVVPVVDQAPTPDTLSLSDPAFTIDRGEGGYELFNRLGIDQSKWADNAEQLLRDHGNDFMRLPNGGIGLSHTGLLDEATRADLLKLK